MLMEVELITNTHAQFSQVADLIRRLPVSALVY